MNSSAQKPPATVAQVGCGNIGSHLTPLLARDPRIGTLRLFDHDKFEARNIISQDIDRKAIGRPKAEVLAARAQEIRPDLRVIPHVAAVEQLPIGLLRADLIVACLDSRRARQHVNQIAYRLGVPWIDTAVGTEGLLARITVFLPGIDQPCLECGWDQADYDAIEQLHPCGAVETRPTAGVAALGAITAAIAAIECDKLLAGDRGSSIAGRQLLVGVGHHSHDVTVLTRNPSCLFDHHIPEVESSACDIEKTSLREFVSANGHGHWSLAVEGFRFARRMACSCGETRETLALLRQSDGLVDTCRTCGKALKEVGFDSRGRLSALDVTQAQLELPLSRIGFLPGDLVYLENDGRARTILLRTSLTKGHADEG